MMWKLLKDNPDLADLIVALEATTEPSRALDARIYSAIYDLPDMGYESWSAVEAEAPRYCSSIDAALTLMPGDYGRLDIMLCERGRSYVARGVCSQPCYDSDGATPAIALCIAALKARNHADS